ncbi:hypothetical protein VCRA2128O102_380036 [Vibrio crassostreae]|nr:hypothetical protein VCRA2128O106_390019 [Vibrio crassostreae]CAK2941761.1 hypothetical protein VCRA2128O100_410019 [Vibrio crassostreae]CAK3400294.1 hypothetical protein VCRA2128O102_380036 [Vibrio crassostreae]CAK3532858.1 hypothetical protein VCRA2128O107_400036 [Vibrio crassostreae]CAK3537978.1 hypothetical protein VCRA2126O88_400035 [Vibrio crassostreae]
MKLAGLAIMWNLVELIGSHAQNNVNTLLVNTLLHFTNEMYHI